MQLQLQLYAEQFTVTPPVMLQLQFPCGYVDGFCSQARESGVLLPEHAVQFAQFTALQLIAEQLQLQLVPIAPVPHMQLQLVQLPPQLQLEVQLPLEQLPDHVYQA